MSARAAWPLARFMRTVLWYSPFGRLFREASLEAATPRVDAPPSRASQLVLVTGAAGATGSRVVRELLADGSKVRAMVRDSRRGADALRKRGVDVSEALNSGRLEFVVTDLYNVVESVMQDVTAVISCTGTRVGPPGDTPDRAMYLQGLSFYTPVVLDDTPQNVEYVGVSKLAEASAKHLSAVQPRVVPVFEHGDAQRFAATWGSLDDVVMGGVSESSARCEDGEMVFAGNTATANNGGFASVRTANFERPLDLSSFDGMRVRVKGDGSRYKFLLRCEQRWDGIGFGFSFDTEKGKWIDVMMPFDAFTPTLRGKLVDDAIDTANIYSFQVMLSKFEYDFAPNPNFTAGQFELRLGAFCAYSAAKPTCPRFVHLSSAGVTRLFRKDEFPDIKSLPPAVQMNDMLGRIMEYKLAGEDAIRRALADVGYVIVRPTALTEKPPLGMTAVKVEQGDNMTGQIGRDDVARLLIECLYRPLNGCTFEVASGDSVDKETFDANVALDRDAPSRSFAEFPYVPQ